MDLLAAWLLYPVALACICLGLALLVERLTAWRTPGALMLPIGFATLLALARLITAYEATARLALPVIGALALAGLVLGRARLRALRADAWLLGTAAALYLVLAAPVVLSGTPSFAGYLALPDTSHQLALADLYAHRGPDWTGLADGANRATMKKYITTSYPVTAQATVGVTAPLGALDLAWLYQPFIAFAVIVMALSLWSLVAPLLGLRWQAAVVVFTASQSALLFGNYLLGSIKELTTAALLLALVAVVTAAIREPPRGRTLLPVAIIAAAALGALGPAAIPYLAVPGLVVIVVWGYRLLRAPRVADLAWLAAGCALLGVLALPVLRTLRTAVTVSTTVLVDLKDDPGHLAGPLDIAQGLGIWLSGDFRYATTDAQTPQAILLVIAGICAVVGIAWVIRRRHWGPLLLLATFVLVSAYLLARGSIYADSKVLMIASPVVLALAMLGAASLWTGRWRVLSALATSALVVGVAWSTALAYHDVSLAPYERYSELVELDDRLAGRGPAFFGEYDEFAEYFMSAIPVFSSPEFPHPFRSAPYDPDALRDLRRRPSEKTPVDIDDVAFEYIDSLTYVILRRGPHTSRPPAGFRLLSRGTYYDLWRRTPGLRVLDHLPLGPDVLNQAAVVSEPAARSWARRARELGGRIAFVRREPPPTFLVTETRLPGRWFGYGNFPSAVVTGGPSDIRATIEIPRTGRYHVWVEGSFARPMTIGLDSMPLPDRPAGLNNPGAYASLGTVHIIRGRHDVTIRQGGGDPWPGTGGYRSSLRHIGPIVFNPIANESPAVSEIDPARWRQLVGVRADWLEIVKR